MLLFTILFDILTTLINADNLLHYVPSILRMQCYSWSFNMISEISGNRIFAVARAIGVSPIEKTPFCLFPREIPFLFQFNIRGPSCCSSSSCCSNSDHLSSNILSCRSEGNQLNSGNKSRLWLWLQWMLMSLIY